MGYNEQTNPDWTPADVEFFDKLKQALLPLTYKQKNAFYAWVTQRLDSNLGGKAYLGNDLNSQVFPELSGKTLLTIQMGTQNYGPDTFSQAGTTVSWLLTDQLFNGTIVLTWQHSNT